KRIYGLGVDDQASRNHIRHFVDWPALKDWLENDSRGQAVEALVIALPLHLHAPIAIQAMRLGQKRVQRGGKPTHVRCEKLMAWKLRQCKEMVRTAIETGSILSIGHQRHYSLVYAHATEVVKSGVLGDIKHIRALWHRNFSWPAPDPKTLPPQVE